MSISLSRFDLGAMLRAGIDLRQATQGLGSMEEAARAVTRYFHQKLVDPETGARECVLARFYKTHDYGALEPDLQAFARERLGGRDPWDDMKCLTLLATSGDEPEWNVRRASRGHRAIPLASVEVVERAPMIAQLVRDMGLDADDVVAPQPELIGGLEGKTYNVFHVADARGSPHIPAQRDFVAPYGIRSVVGCGGILLTGELFALILFSRVEISHESAERFRNVALDLKLAISPFRTVFSPEAPAVSAPPPAVPG
jgi:hypothetical protein